jgi:hypothetical protein
MNRRLKVMKMRWFPFIALALIVIFLGGILLGSVVEADQQSDLWIARINVQNTIAVVNSDVGVIVEDGDRLNYSSAIIQALEEEFVQASPALAETGFLDGTFGAVIIFPYNVSERVISFNDRYPQRVQLEFMINPNLPEREYVEVYLRILNLQLSINSTLAHTYVNSIFGQLHGAQNQVSDIFQNINRDLTAMEIIAFEQFTPSLNLEYIPEIPFDPESFDGSGRFVSKEGLAGAVASLYLDSYMQASSSFLTMREGVFTMTENIPQQATGWLVELEEWAAKWEDFGVALETYKDFATGVINNLNQLLYDLDGYLDYVERVVDLSYDFHGDLSNWHDNVEQNYTMLNAFLSDLLVYIDLIEYRAGERDDYKYYLELWDDGLRPRYDGVNSWSANLAWYNTMNNLQDNALAQINNAINDRPVRSEFQPPAPGVSIAYQDAVGAWFANIVNVSNTALSTLLTHMGQHLGNPLPPGIFNNIESFLFYGDPPQRLGLIETDNLSGLEWGNVSIEDPVVDPFTRNLPNFLNVFDYQNPEERAPESIEGFLDPLEDLRGQIEIFEMEAYLTDSLWQEVEGKIGGVGSYLDSVGGELSAHVDDNYMLLAMIYSEYIDFLTRIRQEASNVESYGIVDLHERLERFHEVHNLTRLDTIARLIDFSGMMPESRVNDGVNLALVDHAITPFEFTPPIFREDTTIDMFGEYSLYDRFGRFLWIGIFLAGLIFVITLSSHLVSLKKKKVEDDEVEGFF